jgi:hypothetical protein
VRYFLASDPAGGLVLAPHFGETRAIRSVGDLDAVLAESDDPTPVEVWTWDSPATAFVTLTLFAIDQGRRLAPAGWPAYCRSLRQWHDQLGRPGLPRKPRSDDPFIQSQWTRRVYRELRGVCLGLFGSEGMDRDVLRSYVHHEVFKGRLEEREACAGIAEGLGRRLDVVLTTNARQMAREIAGQIRMRR